MGKEHPHAHLLQIISILAFSLIWFFDSFILKFSTEPANSIPLSIRIILFIIMFILGLILIGLAHKALFGMFLHGERHETSTLVTTGIFAHVRNPMYLGTFLIFLAFILATFSLISLIPWVLIVILFDKMTNYEEKDIERIFGEEYLEYKSRVPKWIPR
ncbi:MAG: isoprenylcysteine carboxylmethyltransferase family protein [Candidatus Wukongarchaeota archaeon]|nr:isoprenylcysteine carboxylmethyltransferase family protein [Candidatus Wukongarchaeota archaeon]